MAILNMASAITKMKGEKSKPPSIKGKRFLNQLSGGSVRLETKRIKEEYGLGETQLIMTLNMTIHT
jgi:hypothetical protein